MDNPTDSPATEAPTYPTVKEIIVATLTPQDVDDFNADAQAQAEVEAGGFEIDEADLIQKAEALDRITEQAELVEELERETERAQRAYKAKKNEWEGAVKDLTKLIRGSKERHPLFDREPAPAPAEAPDDGDDAWRDEPTAQLVSFGLTDSIMKALEDADLLTMGDLADWTKDGRRRPEDIPGVGPAKAEALSDALGKFWGDHFAKHRAAMSQTVADAAAKLQHFSDEIDPALAEAATSPAEAPSPPQDATTDPGPCDSASEPPQERHGANKTVHAHDPGPTKAEPKKTRKRKAG